MSLKIDQKSDSIHVTIIPDYKVIEIIIFVSIINCFILFVLFQMAQQLIRGELNLLFQIIAIYFIFSYLKEFFNFYWATTGFEILEISNDNLVYKKCLWFIQRSYVLDKSRIKFISLMDYSKSNLSSLK